MAQIDLKWLLVFILFAALCVAAMKAEAETAQTIGEISAFVFEPPVTISEDSNGQIIADTRDLYIDCGMVPGVGYLCNF